MSSNAALLSAEPDLHQDGIGTVASSTGFGLGASRSVEAIARLRAELGAASVLTGADISTRHGKDWSSGPAGAPIAVVRPVDARGVSAAVLACREANLPFVPQGGLTGLCGGATPEDGWVVISTERMSGIQELDPNGSTLTVWAGTPLATIQAAADAAGFLFPLDLGSRGSCVIGGNLSTNAGGNRVIRYGMTRELVLGIEVVLADGTVLTNLNKLLKNNAGYDLKHLFIGSEGTLGIITRAVLRLFPKPRSTMAALCALPDSAAAVVDLLAAARDGLGPLLSAFEVMWPDYWHVITERCGVRPPVGSGHGAYVLIEAQGADDLGDPPRFEAWLESVMERGLLVDAAVAQSHTQTQAFWAVRDACSEFGQVLGPHIAYDIGLAVALIDAFVTRCKARLADEIPGCESIYYGHVGDGNLHLVAWVEGRSIERQPKLDMDRVIYGLVREMGGSISAEHGIGTAKKHWLGHARSEADIALMRTLKNALDPARLLNPGKVF